MKDQESKKTIRKYAFASFLNDLGSDMIYPIWPLFVTSLGANMTILGFIDGLGEAIVSISQALSGYVSDRIRKRKVFVWLGYICASLSRIGYAFSTAWQQVVPFRILDRAGKIRSAPRDAIIADLSTHENRGGNFGFLRTMDNLGAVCGILICIFFVELLGYERLFLLAALPSIAAVLLILSLGKEKKPADKKLYQRIRLRDFDRNFKLFLGVSAVFAMGSFSYSFLLIYAKKLGFQIVFVPVLYLIFTAFAAISSLPFGKLSDRIGRKALMAVSFILWGGVCLIFIFVENYLAIVLSFVLYGLHRGAIDTVQKTFVSELAPEDYRASGLGGFQMVIGLCALPASLIAGLLWDRISINAPFYLSLVLTVTASIILLFVNERREGAII
ncbi:MAG: MFS transporter [Deltaproteobacteria bacterium]|nr:MFS transporter [Deltaproteobacteria bacterium]